MALIKRLAEYETSGNTRRQDFTMLAEHQIQT